MKDPELAAVLPESNAAANAQPGLLVAALREYTMLQEGTPMHDGRRLRDDAVSHTLIREDRTPTVSYEALYELHDIAEQLTARLFAMCDRGKPSFLEHEAVLAESAKLFWDTYFAGMRAVGPTQL